MNSANADVKFVVVPSIDGWSIDTNGEVTGNYATKEAALEAVTGAASNAIKQGVGVTISVPRSGPNDAAIGTRTG